MADKFRVTYPISVTFGTGEQPSSIKLNAINDQARNALTLIERAIGDPWNQSGDSLLLNSPLQIANLARAIGEQAHMNARFIKPNMQPTDTILIEQELSEEVGANRFKLDFKPYYPDPGDSADPLNFSINGANGGGVFDSTGQTSLANVTAAGNFFVDTTTGIVTLGTPLSGTLTVQYLVENQNLNSDGPDEFAANVIPPPGQVDWNGLKIVQLSAGKYLLVLPPRRPTSELSLGLGKVPGVSNSHPWTNTTNVTAGTQEYHYWYVAPGTNDGEWDDTSPAKVSPIASDTNRLPLVQDPRYRYQLPEELHDYIVSGAAGATLPSGSLFLWDTTEKTAIEGVTFRIPEADDLYNAAWSPRPGWVIQAEGADLDSLFSGFTSTDATDDPADYQSRFSMIAIGNSMAAAIDKIRYHQLTQRNTVDCLARPIRHRDLVQMQPASGDRGYVTKPHSYRAYDDHPDYLSRQGSFNGANTRDRYNNAMLGDLLMGSTSSASDYQNVSANSNKIAFGLMGAAGLEMYLRSSATGAIAFQGSTPDPARMMSIDHAPVHLSFGALSFGTNNTLHGTDFTGILSNFGYFKLFSLGDAQSSSVTTGEAIFLGSSHLDSTPRATNDDYKGINDARWVRIEGTSSLDHKIEFKGDDLNLSAYGSETHEVRVGFSNGNTHLRVYNNALLMGSGDDGITGSNGFFYAWQGASNPSVVSRSDTVGTNFIAGELEAIDGNIYLGSDGAGGTASNRRILSREGSNVLAYKDGNNLLRSAEFGDLYLGGNGSAIGGSNGVWFDVTQATTSTLEIKQSDGGDVDVVASGDLVSEGGHLYFGSQSNADSIQHLSGNFYFRDTASTTNTWIHAENIRVRNIYPPDATEMWTKRLNVPLGSGFVKRGITGGLGVLTDKNYFAPQSMTDPGTGNTYQVFDISAWMGLNARIQRVNIGLERTFGNQAGTTTFAVRIQNRGGDVIYTWTQPSGDLLPTSSGAPYYDWDVDWPATGSAGNTLTIDSEWLNPSPSDNIGKLYQDNTRTSTNNHDSTSQTDGVYVVVQTRVGSLEQNIRYLRLDLAWETLEDMHGSFPVT